MKSLADYDAELETLGKQHAELWGRIMQTRAQRNLALTQYARANRDEPTMTYKPATWNVNGHVNSNFSIEEQIA
jgi:hypothetical protein